MRPIIGAKSGLVRAGPVDRSGSRWGRPQAKETDVAELQVLFTQFVTEILGVGAVLLVVLLVSQALKRLINVLRDLQHVSPLIATRLHALRRWVLTLLTVLMVLEALGIFKGAWALLSTMLAALALGFVAAWSVLSNATAAMLILIFRPFRIGDEVEIIELTNGFTVGGRVLDMNLLYTTLEVAPEETAVPAAPPAEGMATPPLSAEATPLPPPTEGSPAQPHGPDDKQPASGRPLRLVRVPNNLFFQRPLRTHSSYSPGSKAPFFSGGR